MSLASTCMFWITGQFTVGATWFWCHGSCKIDKQALYWGLQGVERIHVEIASDALQGNMKGVCA